MKVFVTTMALSVLLFATTFLQSQEAFAQPTIFKAELARNGHAVYFTSAQAVPSLSVEVFDMRGRRIFHGLSSGRGILWDLRDAKGRKVPNGIYFYRVTSLEFGGQYYWGDLKKFTVVR